MFKKRCQTLPKTPSSTSKKRKGLSSAHHKPLHGGSAYADIEHRRCAQCFTDTAGIHRKPQPEAPLEARWGHQNHNLAQIMGT